LKPTTSYILPGSAIEVPQGAEVHHEGITLFYFVNLTHIVELAVVIGKKGRNISAKSAMDYVYGK
jgi:acylpyruvate hydrolase